MVRFGHLLRMSESFTRQNRMNPSTEVTSGPPLTGQKKATHIGWLIRVPTRDAYPKSMLDSGMIPLVSNVLIRAHCIVTNATYAGFNNA